MAMVRLLGGGHCGSLSASSGALLAQIQALWALSRFGKGPYLGLGCSSGVVAASSEERYSCWGGGNDGVPAAVWRGRGLYGPDSGPTERAYLGMVCPCCSIQPATVDGGGGHSLARVTVMPALAGVPSSQCCQPSNVGHGESMVVIARLWWRVLVGDKFGGALRIVQGCAFLGSGKILVVSTPTW
jgi:hypothetical protein